MSTARPERDPMLALAFAWADLVIEARDGMVTFAAGAAGPLLGMAAEKLVGRTLEALVLPSDVPVIRHTCRLLERHGRCAETFIRLRGPQGSHPRAALAGLGGGAGRLFLALRAQVRLPGADDDDGTRDSTTGLHQPEGFHAIGAARLKDLAAMGREAALSLLSVDGLDGALTSLPEDERDALSAALGALIRSASIDGDSAVALEVGKYGFLSERAQDMSALQRDVAALVAEMAPSRPVEVATTSVAVGAATGIAEEDLARGLMYTLQTFQRSEGAVGLGALARNMTTLVDHTVGQITAYRDMVAQGRFDVALQPIISLRSGAIHHYEALCRFHSLGPDVSPYKVIAFAEEIGLIHQFDLSMAAKVIEWLRRQPGDRDVVRVAVNISGFSVSQPSYLEGLRALLAREPWTVGRLMFEITESSRMSDLDAAETFIQSLRGQGYEVCLDDFGAGAASFQYLSALDVDVVKLDGSAVKNAQRVAKGRAFLTALTGLCKQLGVETVAEMVDTPESLRFVRDCGCDYVQGWLFGKPSLQVGDFSPLPNGALLRG